MSTKRNLKSWFKRHILTMLVISGLIYIIALPFIEIYALIPAHYPYYLLIILTDVAPAVAFFVSFTLPILLASYLLRHYPKGRRVFE